MKILIIGFYTKTYMPYILNYEKFFNDKNIIYDVVCFDRDSDGAKSHIGNVYTFKKRMGVNKIKKVIPYFEYISYVKKLIKKRQYDRLIVLTTVPAVLLKKILHQNYSGKYIFDFRDYSYENILTYRKIVNKIVSESFATFVSSKGFMHYLNKSSQIHFVHNLSNLDQKVSKADEINKDKIVIGFAGYVRYYDVNTELIRQLGNKSEYEIQYYGTAYEDCNLKTFIKDNGIENVTIFDTYINEEKPRIYADFSFINSIYSLQSKEVVYAVPNRLYDAVLYKKPIIVAKNTYLQEIVETFHLGFAIDLKSEDLQNAINKFLCDYDTVVFTHNCNAFLESIKRDEDDFQRIMSNFIC